MKLHCTRTLAVAQYETLGIIAPFIDHMIVTRSGMGNCQKEICVSNPFSIGLLSMVSAAATSAFQLEHTSRLLRSVCPGGYQIRTIEYGKMLVMLVYGEYYGHVYEVYKL